MLARTLEAAGLCTLVVTMMPFWAEKVGTPRTLAVEFPFGHTLGRPGDVAGQRRVINQALTVWETAVPPHPFPTIHHSPETWPEPLADTLKAWQPATPSPIIAQLGPQLRQLLRQRRAPGSENLPAG